VTTLRPPTDEDVATAAALVGEHWPEPIDGDRIRRDWSAPWLDRERDVRISDETYVVVEDMREGRAWIELHGRPTEDAFRWAEGRAAELEATRLFGGAWSTDDAVLEALATRGYTHSRQSFRMEVDLAHPLPQPIWPDGISMRTIRQGEERAVFEAHQESFRDTWEPIEDTYEEWTHWHLAPERFDPDLWFLAMSGDEICGLALCHPHPTVPELGWVGILGVRRPWRRRGIARALLLHAFSVLRERGLERAGLGVDSESPTGAHTLYEDAGMRVTQLFEIYEKELT
jgi:GNAT superfamily N-acetyltransferase